MADSQNSHSIPPSGPAGKAPSARPPALVWLLVGLLGLESLFWLGLTVLGVRTIFAEYETEHWWHERDIFMCSVALLIGLGLAAVALFIAQGHRWSRKVCIVWECIMVVLLVFFAVGFPGFALAAMVIPVGVLILLFRPSVKAYTVRK